MRAKITKDTVSKIAEKYEKRSDVQILFLITNYSL